MEQIQVFINGPIGSVVVNLLLALLILLVGYIIARIVASIVNRLLKRINLDNRVIGALSDPDHPRDVHAENIISGIVFWLIMLFAILAALEQLNLTAISVPLAAFLNRVMTVYLPRLAAAAVLLVVAWLIATALRILIRKGAAYLRLDERVNRHATGEAAEPVAVVEPGVESAVGVYEAVGEAAEPVAVAEPIAVGEPLATAVFWFVFLLFLPAVLNALGLASIAAPIQGIFDAILGYIPNILSAIVIILIGWFAARIIRNVVTNFLAAVGVDRFGQRIGLTEGRSLSSVIGSLLYIFVLLVVAISALEALNIAAISVPATRMLTSIINVIPSLLGAAAILIIAYYIGRFVGNLVRDLLTNLEFNSMPARLGITWGGTRTPAEWVGWLAWLMIMLFAATTAVELLGSEFLVVAFGLFIRFLVNLALALVIFAIGLYFATMVYRIISSTQVNNAHFIAQMGRIAVIVFATALGLGQLGIAESIVNLAFGIMLGAIGIAIALAFGLGGREVAGREVENFVSFLRSPAKPDEL